MRAPMGSTTPTISAAMASTTISSSRVKPAARRTLSVGNVSILPFTTRRAIGTKRDQVEITTLTRDTVLVGIAPGIEGDFLQVGTVPAIGRTRLLHEGVESVLVAGIATHVEPVDFQRLFEVADLRACGLALRTTQLAEHARAHQAGQQGQDGEHDKQLHQCETCGSRSAVVSVHCVTSCAVRSAAPLFVLQGAAAPRPGPLYTRYMARSLTDRMPIRMAMMISAMPPPITRISSGSSSVRPRLTPACTSSS